MEIYYVVLVFMRNYYEYAIARDPFRLAFTYGDENENSMVKMLGGVVYTYSVNLTFHLLLGIQKTQLSLAFSKKFLATGELCEVSDRKSIICSFCDIHEKQKLNK